MTRMVTKMNGLQSTNAGFVLSSGKKDQDFELFSKVLYKKAFIFNQVCYKLCLPTFLAKDILQIEHLRNSHHLQIKPLTDRFSYLFYVPKLLEKAGKVIKSCLTCLLAQTSYKQKIKLFFKVSIFWKKYNLILSF